MSHVTDINYGLTSTSEVLLTSEAGDKLTRSRNITFKQGSADAENVIRVRPDIVKQTLQGIGSSFTESSAFVLAHLDEAQRAEVMNNIYGEQGANFSLARTPMGATGRVPRRFARAVMSLRRQALREREMAILVYDPVPLPG